MKVGCNFCGCHFPEDFEMTLEPPCNFWGDKRMANLPVDIKKKVWGWIFSCPIPDVEHFGKCSMAMDFMAVPKEEPVKFVDIVKNWNELTDEERKDFQRNYFKNRGKIPQLPIQYDTNQKD